MSTAARSTSRTLTEAASKELLAGFGVPFPTETSCREPADAVRAAREIGFPVVAKLNGEGIAHKTERGLVRLGLADEAAVERAARELLEAATESDGEVDVLIAPMLRATRELIAGLSTDEQFGMTVLLGVGGILAEAIADVSTRLVPIEAVDAEDMIDDLSTRALLGPFRGEPAVDREALVQVLLALSQVAQARPDLVSADLNPLLVVDGRPIAVDALVEVRA